MRLVGSVSASASLGEDRGICFRPTPKATGKKWQLQEAAQRLLPDKRGLQRCSRGLTWGDGGVKVWKGKTDAWFTGLMQCGSVWICPVCAAKIARQRADELQRGIDYALATGSGCMMVTLTFSHGRCDILDDTMSGFSRALHKLKSGRPYRALMDEYGIYGEVRAMEVTHGQANGWHPHTHAITFSRTKLSAPGRFRFECRLFVLWREACRKAGIGLPEFGPGVHVRPAKDAADYVAKWGFATEVTHSHIKAAKPGGLTPWQLLAAAADGDKRAAWLFREFAGSFHGKRQLYYSPGLRQRLGLFDEITDQELLSLEPDEKTLVCALDKDEWLMVLKFKMRASVLAAASDCAESVRALLDGLRTRARAEVGSDGRTERGLWLAARNYGWAA